LADQGIWFKLWDGWEDDAEIANLSKEDKLHWVLLGGYLKKHGNSGMTCLSKPASALQKKLMLQSYETLIEVLKRMPGYDIEEKQNPIVTSVTILTVTAKNWLKYQGDNSLSRVRKFRANVTLKKRREEKREEEKENKKRFIPPTPAEIAEFVKLEKLKIDPQRFFNHYEANGWRVGKNPMKNWKATARNWKQEDSFNAHANKPANAFVATGTESSKYDDLRK
jgi:hypothetical protein